jgi:shikimate kinase
MLENHISFTPRQHVFLTGFMGSGKSYWSRRLAAELSMPLIEMDDVIEEKAGRSIVDIFEGLGETFFRVLEREILQNIEYQPFSIVSTGGGTPCFFDNMAWMNAHGKTIFLDTPAEVLAVRMEAEIEKRPLLRDLDAHELRERIEIKLQDRASMYEQAQYIIPWHADDKVMMERLMQAITS